MILCANRHAQGAGNGPLASARHQVGTLLDPALASRDPRAGWLRAAPATRGARADAPTAHNAPRARPGGLTAGAGRRAAAMGGEKGKIDLLLKFFDSQHFDAWVALTYLYKSTSSPGVTDYLCNRLYTLPEEQVEGYLSQLCQLIINRPHSPLERVLVDLCARSLRIAVKVRPAAGAPPAASPCAGSAALRARGRAAKRAWPPTRCSAPQVYWLLLAISQDNPKNRHAADMRDKCERAALEGFWVRGPCTRACLSCRCGADRQKVQHHRWADSALVSECMRGARGAAGLGARAGRPAPALLRPARRVPAGAAVQGAQAGAAEPAARALEPDRPAAQPHGAGGAAAVRAQRPRAPP